MSIPLSSSAVEKFTPDSLKNLVDAPVFRLRPITGDVMPAVHDEVEMAGLFLVSEEDLRDEMKRCIREGWSEAEADADIARIDALWDARAQNVPIDPAEEQAFAELEALIYDRYPSYRRLAIQKTRFENGYSEIIMRYAIAGWSNLESPFSRVAGAIPRQTLVDAMKVLAEIEKRAIADGVEGAQSGLSVIQLMTACFGMVRLPESARKNSASPSPESSDPSGSTATAQPSPTDTNSSERTGKRRRGAGTTSS